MDTCINDLGMVNNTVKLLTKKEMYNRENETSSILKTKRAKTLFFSLPFFSQKNGFSFQCLENWKEFERHKNAD